MPHRKDGSRDKYRHHDGGASVSDSASIVASLLEDVKSLSSFTTTEIMKAKPKAKTGHPDARTESSTKLNTGKSPKKSKKSSKKSSKRDREDKASGKKKKKKKKKKSEHKDDAKSKKSKKDKQAAPFSGIKRVGSSSSSDSDLSSDSDDSNVLIALDKTGMPRVTKRVEGDGDDKSVISTATSNITLSQRFGTGDERADAAKSKKSAAISLPSTEEMKKMARSCCADDPVGANEVSVEDAVYDVQPTHEIKATKMSEFLKQKGHDVPVEESTASCSKSGSPVVASPKVNERDSDDSEAFPLSKLPRQKKPKVPILKTNDLMPRNLKLSEVMKKNEEKEKERSNTPDDADARGRKGKLSSKSLATSALSRLTGGDAVLDSEFKPPNKKLTCKLLGSTDANGPNAEGDEELKTSSKLLAAKGSSKKIVIGAIQSAKPAPSTFIANGGRRTIGEEGEISMSDRSESDSDDAGGLAEEVARDTDGELDSDNEANRTGENKGAEDGEILEKKPVIPAKSVKKEPPSPIRETRKKVSKKKRKRHRSRSRSLSSRSRSPSPSANKSKPKRKGRGTYKAHERSASRSRSRTRSRSPVRSRGRRCRSRSRSRSRSRGRRNYGLMRSRSRSRTRSPRRRGNNDSTYYNSFRENNPRFGRNDDRSFRYQRGRTYKPTETDVKKYPWGQGGRIKKRTFSRSPPTPERSRSRSRSRSRAATVIKSDSPTPRDDEGRIDKKKLFEIARRNASAMLQVGTMHQLRNMTAEECGILRSGGRSVEELTEYCKKLQKREKKEDKAEGKDVSDVSSDESEDRKSEDEIEKLIQHPFAVNPDKPLPQIMMNIHNSTPLVPKTAAQLKYEEQQLRVSFPVSSGQQHREQESQWTPVDPSIKAITSAPDLPEMPEPKLKALPPPPKPPDLSTPTTEKSTLHTSAVPLGPVALPGPAEATAQYATNATSMVVNADPVYHQPPPPPKVEISQIINSRLDAVKRMQANPNDVEAIKALHEADEHMKQWAASKNLPGQFAGSTGASVLTPAQLGPADKRYEAWAKPDTLTSAPAVNSGVGMNLLVKMGWKPGTGLGKDNTGSIEPLTLDIKNDRRGLQSLEEMPSSNRRAYAPPISHNLSGKHPVSVLMEICNKRRWGPPQFTCHESGPPNNRRFLFKAIVNGVEYQPATPSNNKKSGKTQTAQVVLQSLGLVPRDTSLPVIIG